MEMKTTIRNANGLNFRVFDEGSGEPVLLLHGYPDSIYLWREVIPLFLQQGYRVITYDQRGFGESDAPVGIENYRIKHMVKDFKALLKLLVGSAPIKVIGHDWGASVGWAAAIGFPELFSSLVAISVGHPTAYYKEGGFEQEKKRWYTLAFLWEGFAETLFSQNDWAAFRLFFNYHAEVDKRWIPDLSREGRFTAALNWYRANIPAGYETQISAPACKVPTLGIYSEFDIALSEAQMVNSQNHMAAPWVYRKISDCGHHIPLDKPIELVNTILDYYKGL